MLYCKKTQISSTEITVKVATHLLTLILIQFPKVPRVLITQPPLRLVEKETTTLGLFIC